MAASSASAYPEASKQISATAGHRASGSFWRTKPPAAGPISQPICHDALDSAMQRPSSRGWARSTTSGA